MMPSDGKQNMQEQWKAQFCPKLGNWKTSLNGHSVATFTLPWTEVVVTKDQTPTKKCFIVRGQKDLNIWPQCQEEILGEL